MLDNREVRKFTLNRGVTTIGRAQDNDIVINNITQDVMTKAAIGVSVVLYDVRPDDQLLLVYQLGRYYPGASVQFFVGNQWITTEPVDDVHETMAILIDMPAGAGRRRATASML